MDASITMLVNNAGIGAATPLLTSDISVMEKIIALNVTALTRLSYAAARAFSNRGEGIITNLASSVAIYPEQLNGVYSASKAFVLAFSRSLHHELADKGIRDQVVLPGANGHRLLGYGRHAAWSNAQGHNHVARRCRRRRDCRVEKWRVCHDPFIARKRRLGGI
jgi:NAD(P)-dependent dehydrogenase (short-subunit alcohol dehydrogenase family)